MTAPLVAAQWISSQYFSTVEPDIFGAGDKMLQNSVGGVGVVVGRSGDPAIGLPMQSVMLGERAHDPLRLLEGRSGVFFVSETHVSRPDYLT